MKKHTIALLACAAVLFTIGSLMSSCKKTANSSGSSDSGTFLFHLHTQIYDSTIGGLPTLGSNAYVAADSNYSDGCTTPWCYDSLGRRIELFVPQFFISNIMLVNATGAMLPLTNVVVLKGLDSEDYYLAKVPVGVYVSAMFTVGLSSADNNLPPATLFVTDGVPYPFESTMCITANTAGYYGMIIKGAYDTSLSADGENPLPFNFYLPNSLTSGTQVSMPTRGSASFPVLPVTAGGTTYMHILCDYGKLMSVINLKTDTATNGTTNASIATTLANNIPNMFRYEE